MGYNKTTGAAAELAVARELAKEGFVVSFPHGDDSKFDLISTWLKVTKRIQVKTASIREQYQTYKVGFYHGNANKEIYKPEEIDVLAVYLPYADDFKHEVVPGVYFIPVMDAQVGHGTFYPPGTHKQGADKVCKYEKFRNNLDILK